MRGSYLNISTPNPPQENELQSLPWGQGRPQLSPAGRRLVGEEEGREPGTSRSPPRPPQQAPPPPPLLQGRRCGRLGRNSYQCHTHGSARVWWFAGRRLQPQSLLPHLPSPTSRDPLSDTMAGGHCGLCGEESDCPWFTWTPPDPALGTCGQSPFSPRLYPGPLSLDLRHDLGASVPLSAVGAGVGTYLTDQRADHSLLDLVTVPP